ncbi:MAG: AAC(3) family N-acetyltransferase [Candidatus Cryosericum sp.]
MVTEQDAIALCAEPRTRESLAHDLRELGVAAGMTILVHSSLSSLGWVCGGPVALIQALMDVVTDDGTIAMPAMSASNTDPAAWRDPPIPAKWIPVIRANMPAYDPATTPTRGMGFVPEVFRTWPGVVRSAHPNTSFSAWGRNAHTIVDNHELTNCMGEHSPLARLYDLDASVVLLGVGYDHNTCFHLAEYRAPGATSLLEGSAIMLDGQRVWATYQDIVLHDERFGRFGAAFEEECVVTVSYVGSAQSRLFSLRHAVDFAVEQVSVERLQVEPS